MVNTKLIQDTEQSKESIDRVIEGIRQVLKEAYPDKDPEAFIYDVDWHEGSTMIGIGIQHNMTKQELEE